MDESTPRHWFPAKRYGWGWSLPTAWQGWAVLALFMALVVAGVAWFAPSRHGLGFGVYLTLITAALLAVCWIKGEPPVWRWGGK